MIVRSALNLLHGVREQTDAIGVAFSGGKDAHATLDLCCRVFRRVEAFYLYRVPGLQVIERLCDGVRRRYGVTVRHLPHFDLSRCFKFAVLQPHWAILDDTPRVTMHNVETAFRRDANVQWIAYGWRRSDSRSRAIILSNNRGRDDNARRLFPLRIWRRRDVLTYLRINRIPMPPAFGRDEQGGVDFHPATLRYLRAFWPADYAKILEMFPYAEIQVVSAD